MFAGWDWASTAHDVTVIDNQTLRWGSSTGQGQSGLQISNSPASGNVLTNGAAVNNISITHLNRPITGTTLSSVDILSTLTLTPVSPTGSALTPVTITFGVDYLETDNGATPCADGGINGVGVNVNGCADIYVTDVKSLNFGFTYDFDGAGSLFGDQTYYISFFEATNGLNTLSADACAAVGASYPCLGFETPEGQDTTVNFASLITTEKVVINVPEPSTLALGGIGLVALDASMPDVAAVLYAADMACYDAKRAGRNRVEIGHAREMPVSGRMALGSA